MRKDNANVLEDEGSKSVLNEKKFRRIAAGGQEIILPEIGNILPGYELQRMSFCVYDTGRLIDSFFFYLEVEDFTHYGWGLIYLGNRSQFQFVLKTFILMNQTLVKKA